jgi:hypothetical protein
LTRGDCDFDSGELAARSSRKSAAIESGLRNELSFRNQWPGLVTLMQRSVRRYLEDEHDDPAGDHSNQYHQ